MRLISRQPRRASESQTVFASSKPRWLLAMPGTAGRRIAMEWSPFQHAPRPWSTLWFRSIPSAWVAHVRAIWTRSVATMMVAGSSQTSLAKCAVETATSFVWPRKTLRATRATSVSNAQAIRATRQATSQSCARRAAARVRQSSTAPL